MLEQGSAITGIGIGIGIRMGIGMGIGMAGAAHAQFAPESCWWPRSGPQQGSAREPEATNNTRGSPSWSSHRNGPGSSRAGRGEETQ